MPSYKIHSIKNTKKLSFIIEWDSAEKVKQNLSLDGFIVLTIEEYIEEKNKIPRFAFEALKENKSRTEWRVDAFDIFSAYEILRNDYQYTILKLYPIDVTDPKEQNAILKNILLLYPENTKKTKEQTKTKIFTEVDMLKKYLDILEEFVKKSDAKNTEILLYDIKRVQMINSVSSAEEVIKKIIKTVYNKGSLDLKKEMYQSIVPIAKRVGMFILPPWIFSTLMSLRGSFLMMKILFWSEKKKEEKKEIKKPLHSLISFIQNNNTLEKKMFTNKNIFLLMKKRYRSSWLDIFKSEGSYFYFYSLLRQHRSLFWVKRIQEYIGIISMYTVFFIVFWIILIGSILSPEFLYFNGFLSSIMSIIFVSLVFFFKEI